MEWFLKVVRDNYANFGGRARRKEFWMYYLFQILLILPFYVLAFAFMQSGNETLGIVFMALYGLVALALFIPFLAVAVRRLHDVGRSGWYYLIALIPLVGSIILLVWFATEGDVGDNEYGPDPKAVEPGH